MGCWPISGNSISSASRCCWYCHIPSCVDILRDPCGAQASLERHFCRDVDVVVDEIHARRRDSDGERDGEPDRADQFSERDNSWHHSAPGKVSVSCNAFTPRGDCRKAKNCWASALLARGTMKYRCLANR